MITIISGSNRIGNKTHLVANNYKKILHAKGVEARIFSLEDLPIDFLYPEMFKTKNPQFLKIEQEVVIPTKKFVFILPEYNGSIPGVLKAFIDACEIPLCFHGKKACLAGVSDGRAGNLRGMDDFTNILHHIKVQVLPNKIPISKINSELNEAGEFINPATVKVVAKQIDEFLDF